MEVLSMLKHWRGGGGGGGGGGGTPEPPPSAVTACVNARATTTTIATSALRSSTETEDGDDEGPFFDLEFSVPEEDADGDEVDVGESDDSVAESEEQGGGERELNHTISSERSARLGSLISDPGLSLSPSDDLFFKPSSQPKPGAKLQIFLLGFKKLKSGTAEADSRKQQRQRQRQGKIKSFVVEEVPIVSLFTRDSRTRSSGRPAKLHPDDAAPSPEEKRSSKDALHRYLSKIKPFYVRVSKRHGEKQGFSGPLSSAASDAAGTRPSPVERPHGGGNLQAGLRVVCRRRGKSRSASSAVPVVRSPSRRRDDSSLLELQDGIQSAIAHCKRSFNAGTESSMVRSRSDPGDERAAPPASSTERSSF